MDGTVLRTLAGIKARTHYWIRLADGSEEVGLPYFDGNGTLVSWSLIDDEDYVMASRVTPLEEIRGPSGVAIVHEDRELRIVLGSDGTVTMRFRPDELGVIAGAMGEAVAEDDDEELAAAQWRFSKAASLAADLDEASET